MPTTYGQPRVRTGLLAAAVLLAAAAGALIGFGRLDATYLALAVLVLTPLAVLMIGPPARAATIAAALIYVVVLMWAYISYFSPLFAYDGLTDTGPHTSAKLIAAALSVLPAAWLPLSADRPSTLVLWPLYLLGYVPSIVVPIFIRANVGVVLPFDAALIGSMAIVTVIVRLPPPPIRVPHLSLLALTRLLTGLALLSSLYIVAAFGIHSLPSLGNVYTTRATFDTALGGATAGSYIVPWAGDVINPMLTALGAARRRLDLVILGLLGQLLIYSDTGFKNVLFAVALVPLVYWGISFASRWFGLAVSVATAVILVVAVPARFITGEWSVTLARRVFATPGQIGYYYYEFFSLHPKDHLAHSFLRWFVHSPYNQTLPHVIGSAYFPSSNPNANAHLWADAFANFGFVGVGVFSLVCGFVLWIADGLGRGRDARIAGPMLVIAGLSLSSSALFTSLLTLGIGLGVGVMALMPPVPAAAAPPRLTRRVVRRLLRSRAGPPLIGDRGHVRVTRSIRRI